MAINTVDDNRGLIVFIKPPKLGKVKTRLAGEVGDEAALAIYKKLLRHTMHVINGVDAHKYIFLTEPADLSFDLPKHTYTVQMQEGKDLGQKMEHAFRYVFDQGVSEAIIIGSDNIEITPVLINEGFEKLLMNDVVIGPSNDGGYYLLGMIELFSTLFENIDWSTSKVLGQTWDQAAKDELKVEQLVTLADIDHWEDIRAAGWHSEFNKNKDSR